MDSAIHFFVQRKIAGSEYEIDRNPGSGYEIDQLEPSNRAKALTGYGVKVGYPDARTARDTQRRKNQVQVSFARKYNSVYVM